MNNDWLDIEVLEYYLEGKLDAKTMNRIERKALEDPFVAEALAGLSASPKRSLESISLLQKQLKERVAVLETTKKKSVITWQRLSIGSAAAVLFITVGIVYWMKQVNYQNGMNLPKKVDVVLAPKQKTDTILPKSAVPEELLLPKGEDMVQNKKTTRTPQINARTQQAATASVMSMASRSSMVSGKIVDESTGEPMVGASISALNAQGTLQVVAQANKDGEFSFQKDSSIVDSNITVSYIAYENKVLPIKTDELLAISLREVKNGLDEVVIRGYVKRDKQVTTGSTSLVRGKEVKDVPVANVEQLLQGKVAGLNLAAAKSHPLEGWDQFYMYLTNNNKFKAAPRLGKSVELTFGIDTAGGPQNIKIIKGISAKYNKEAVRLIKDGPKWLQPDSPNAVISLKVDF